eukprot:125467_1
MAAAKNDVTDEKQFLMDNLDNLNLGNNEKIQQLLLNEGIGSDENVVFSQKVCKINRKGKKQDRYLMITQSAIYNIKPKKYTQSKRRVAMGDIGMLTLSAISPEFAIHVPNEYDYHFASKSKDKIADVLAQLYAQETKGKLLIVFSELRHLKDLIVTKKLAKYEQKRSKHVMQETMESVTDVLQEIDDNKYRESDSDGNEQVVHIRN